MPYLVAVTLLWAVSFSLIGEYLAGIDPLDKAGGYAIQQDKHKIIKRVSGSVSNVVGLPVERLKEELNHLFSEKIEEQW